MKSSPSLLIKGLLIAGITGSLLLASFSSSAQVGIKISCAEGWWTDCCRCKNCLQVDPPPAYGYCRHCKLLCPACRKELGDLNEAIEKLKRRNNGLKEAYKAFQNDYAHQQEGLDSVLASTFGDDTKGMGERLNSNYGKYNLALANVVSDFSGANTVTKLATDFISLSQSSGAGEAGTNVGGTLVDILDADRVMKGLTTELITNASNKMVEDIKRGMPPGQAISNFNREARFTNMYSSGVKIAGFIDFGLDIWSLANATQQLFDDLSNMKEHATNATIDQNEMEKITDELLKNLALIDCIKETQDSLKSGGLGFNGFPAANPSYAGKLLLGSLVNKIATSRVNTGYRAPALPGWQLDTLKLNAALSQLKQLMAILNPLRANFEKEIFPPLVPWTLDRWQEIKRPALITMLQRVKPQLAALSGKEKQLKSMTSTVEANINSLLSGYEMDYHSQATSVPEINTLKVNKDSMEAGGAIPANEQWETSPNEKIKAGMGRINMNFPPGVEWSIDIYAPPSKFITNRSAAGKQLFHDIAPGTYLFKLNSIPVENVTIEKGKETRLKTGVLNIVSPGDWEIYDEAKKKFYTSGNKPKKLALPAGIYQLEFEKNYYRVIIKEKLTVRFEKAIPFLNN